MNSPEPAKTCPHCSGPIPQGAPGGLCPRCVLTRAATPTDAGSSTGGPRSQAPSLLEVVAAFPLLEILALIGTGGMSFVYHARERASRRDVALKILHRHLAADPAFVERFDREARTLARLDHPNIVRVFAHGQSAGFCHLTMEYVEGANLRQAMRAGRFTPAQALQIVPALCDALHYAHSQGVLHRDIKPENILLDSQGRVKIADFGIAKLLGETPGTHADITLTLTGHRLGTPHYMAPEQVERPEDVDHRADIYSLGVVFYELLTGELPLGRFPAPSEKAALDRRIDDIVFRALAKERELRQQSAGQVKAEVEKLGTEERPATPEVPLRKSPCFLSTPRHVQSLAGKIYIYTGRGTLDLERERLVFHGSNQVIMIPLRQIAAVSLGEYSRVARPTGLQYIAVQYRNESATETSLFTPYHSQWNSALSTNAVVLEWYQAIREAVRAVQGVAPAAVYHTTLNPPAPENRRLSRVFMIAAVAGALLVPLGIILLGLRTPGSSPRAATAAALQQIVLVTHPSMLDTNPSRPPEIPDSLRNDPVTGKPFLLFGGAAANHPGAVIAASPIHTSDGLRLRWVALADGSVQEIPETDFLSRLALGPTNQHPAAAHYLLGPVLPAEGAEQWLKRGASLSRSLHEGIHELSVDLTDAITHAAAGRFELAVPPLHALLRVLPPNPDREYLFFLQSPNSTLGPDFYETTQARHGGLLALLAVFAARAGDAGTLQWAQAEGRSLWTTTTELTLCERRLDGESDQAWEEVRTNATEILALRPGGTARMTVIRRTKSFGVPPRTNVVDSAWPRLP